MRVRVCVGQLLMPYSTRTATLVMLGMHVTCHACLLCLQRIHVQAIMVFMLKTVTVTATLKFRSVIEPSALGSYLNS